MIKVYYKDGKDNHKTKYKDFNTEFEADGFIIVSWYEHQCYNFEKIKIEKKVDKNK